MIWRTAKRLCYGVAWIAGALMTAETSLAAAPVTAPALNRAAFIRTPAESSAPRINWPRVFGVRPGSPVLHRISISGAKPVTVRVDGLPEGLRFDDDTRTIHGRAPTAAGSVALRVSVRNDAGEASATIEMKVGDQLALTPPMGWNNYNAFRLRISDELIRKQADAMVSSGLADHGYVYLNIDDGWQGTRDANGVMRGNARFPDMKSLGDYVHSRGLKYGIYSSPGPKTCGLFAGSFGHEVLDAQTYAAWGVDYVKYDWCSYESVAARDAGEQYAALLPASADRIRLVIAERIPLIEDRTRPRPALQSQRIRELTEELDGLIELIPKKKRDAIQHELFVRPYKVFGEALRAVDRDIVYSLCQYGMGNPGEWAPSIGGNLWRTTRDITPRWPAIRSIIDRQSGLERFAGPGLWNDPDMLEIGNGELTPDEMHLQMTAWCMLAAPLLIGTDLTKLDALTLSILTNDEVIAVNQDELGRQAVIAKKDGDFHTWTKPLVDGATAVAIFNRSDVEANISVKLADIGIAGDCRVRDVWRQWDVGTVDAITVRVGPHGAEMFKVEVAKPSTAPSAR
jgi:alpha-galactosidase